jgi:hypothetical protein
MTTYVEVSQALVNAGYLTYDNLDAAAAVLADPLSIEYSDAFSTNAAAALLDAELIDEANLDAVAAAIDDVWVIWMAN